MNRPSLRNVEDLAYKIVPRPSLRNFKDLAYESPTYLKASRYPLSSDLLEDRFTNRPSLRNVKGLAYEIVPRPSFQNFEDLATRIQHT